MIRESIKVDIQEEGESSKEGQGGDGSGDGVGRCGGEEGVAEAGRDWGGRPGRNQNRRSQIQSIVSYVGIKFTELCEHSVILRT